MRAPKQTNKQTTSSYPNCKTCEFGPGGAPTGCTYAFYCGMTLCGGFCYMSGILCGPDPGCGSYGPGDGPGLIPDPGGN